MHIDDFRAISLEEIENFTAWWKQQNTQLSDEFPLEQEVGEWDEQLKAWLGLRKTTT